MSNSKQTLLKHKYSISGKEYSTRSVDRKRNRSKEECGERKKGRKYSETDADTDTSTDSDTQLNFEDTVTDQRERDDLQETDEMEEDRFIYLFATALKNEEIGGLMTKTFESTINKKLKPIVDSLSEIKTNNVTRDTKVQLLEETCHSLEAKMDDYEQSKRNRNIIISGLSDDNCCQEGAIEFLNTIPGVTVSSFDIEYALKLRQTRSTNAGTKSNRIRVVMKDKLKKSEIMKCKKLLKNKDTDKWINDDLTPYRSKLQYLARQCVKNGTLAQTWTYDGKIFIKKEAETSGKLITSTKDLPDVEK